MDNCELVLQVGEGLPAELSVHRQLSCALPPSTRKDAFLLPAHGQGMGFKLLSCLFLFPNSHCLHPPWHLCSSVRLVTISLLKMPAPTASKTNWSLCRRRVQGMVYTTSLCLYGPTTDPERSSTPLCCCWRACEENIFIIWCDAVAMFVNTASNWKGYMLVFPRIVAASMTAALQI